MYDGFREMFDEVSRRLPEVDVSIFAAAVADFRPVDPAEGKLKRADVGPNMELMLTENPDVAGGTRESRKAGSIAVGFALETASLLENGQKKLESKEFDLLVANGATEEGAGFEVETNRVTLLSDGDPAEQLPLLSKDEVAEIILDRITGFVESRQ